MCKFQQEFNGEKVDCHFSKIKLLADTLPIDNEELCIFHSKDQSWKIANEFTVHLEQLLEYYENTVTEKISRFESITYIPEMSPFFNGRSFKKEINFNNSFFTSTLNIEDTQFGKATFDNTIFKGDIYFKKVSSKSIYLNYARFNRSAIFTDSIFEDNFAMENITLEGGLTFKDCVFHSNVFLSKIKTNLNGKITLGVRFMNLIFHDFVTFESSEFNTLVDFKKITVYDTLSFHNTQFNYAEAIPVVSSVTFEDIHVKEKGRIEFRGSHDNKIFSNVHDVTIHNEEVEGKLFFEYVDFMKLNEKTRTRLVGATKGEDAKVEIGKGCIKYHNQTPIKTIELGEENQNLVVELCNTFIDYFTKNEGYNLGVEFVDKTDKKIDFFYFSDEIIPYEKFEEQLQRSENNMWQLVKIEGEQLKTKPSEETLPSKIINVTDTMINLASLVMKIGSRIPFGLISKNEIAQLVQTTIPTGTMNPPSNGITVNQIAIFSGGISQSFQIKKLNK